MFNFDNSMLSAFAKCEAHAVVKHVLGRQSRAKKLHADLGTAGHKALELHFQGQSRQAVLDRFELEYDKVIPIGSEPEKPEMAKENLKTILDVYCEQRPPKAFPFEALEFEQTVGVEIAPGFKFWMKRDMLGRDKVSGMKYPVDHKFRFGLINEWWTKKFRLSSQFSGYLWGTSQLTGELCDRAYVNAVSFGKLPDSNRKCSTHKVPYIECRRQHASFELLVYSRTPEQIEKWRQDAIFLAQQAKTYFEAYSSVEMLQYALRRGTFNEACTFCEFADWCRVGFAAEMMDEFTVYSPWEPWAEKTPETISWSSGPANMQNLARVRWFYRQVNDMIVATTNGSPGANWAELAEPMALKTLWQKGRESWMTVWNQQPAAQEAMAAWARKEENSGS